MWIQTFDGAKFDLRLMKPELIQPVTLAVVLSRICRFGGHCSHFYSVAQHSVIVSNLVAEPEMKLPALLHDAHEAYWGFGDICRPAKRLSVAISSFLDIHGDACDRAIAERFGFDCQLFHHPSIKRADDMALATEARDLMRGTIFDGLPTPDYRQIVPVDNEIARGLFLERLQEVSHGFN